MPLGTSGEGQAAKPTPRKESKQAQFMAAMRTKEGISITEAAKRFGWQHHTVRGAIAGAIKKKLKLDVTAEKVQGRGTMYRISAYGKSVRIAEPGPHRPGLS